MKRSVEELEAMVERLINSQSSAEWRAIRLGGALKQLLRLIDEPMGNLMYQETIEHARETLKKDYKP